MITLDDDAAGPAMLDATYGHLLPDALDRARAALDAFIAEPAAEAFGH